MKSDQSLSAREQHRFVIGGLLAMAAALPATAGGAANETYTWSAELVAVDETARTVTVQSRLVSNAEIELRLARRRRSRHVDAGPASTRLPACGAS